MDTNKISDKCSYCEAYKYCDVIISSTKLCNKLNKTSNL